MDAVPGIVIGVVGAGLAFDFVNGFHDASNSIATLVATRVMKPTTAVVWAAFFNVVAVFFFGTAVAHTVGVGLIALDCVTPLVVLCGLLGATGWGIATWRLRLPTSSSHALLGGYAGAAMAHSARVHGWAELGAPIVAAGWIKVAAFIVVAPVLGLLLGRVLMTLLDMAKRRYGWREDAPAYARFQLVSSAFLSLMHGSNDAQKTVGILAGAMMSAGMFQTFTIPIWLLGVSYGMMGLGTLFGGWRIVKTMGLRLTHLTPAGGVCAETGAALSILLATIVGLPVSSTHVTTGSILGVGMAHEPDKVRWTVARRIAWGWIVTIPAASLAGGCIMWCVSLVWGG
jgi:PiT family inorganic phosphate transporter